MANKNTNEDSFGQRLLGTHRLMSKFEQSKYTPEELKTIRKRKARMKMLDMSPAQKKAEKERLLAKRKAKKMRQKKSIRDTTNAE